MTLQTKTLVSLSIAVLLLAALLQITMAILLRSSFDDLEQRQLAREAKLVEVALNQELEGLLCRARDWSTWDEAYALVAGELDELASVTVSPDALAAFQIDFLVFVDLEGRIRCERAAEGTAKSHTATPNGLRAHLAPGNPLLQHDHLDSARSGVLMLDDGAALVCSRPVLRSDQSGPAGGTLVVGRFLDTAFLERVQHRAQLSVEFAPANGTIEPWSVRVVDEKTIEGTMVLRDLQGAPALLCRITWPREVHLRGEHSLRIFSWSLLLVAIAGLAGTVFLTNRFIIARVKRMRDLVRRMTQTADLNQKLPPQDNDELGDLARSFNAMTSTLSHTHEELRRATQSKSDFLANMSHEIRTPMTAILGYADLLANPDQPPTERAECVQTIRRNGSHLLAMINDLLDVSKVEAGQMTLETIECHLPLLLADVGAVMRAQAAAKGLELAFEIRGTIPRLIFTDPTRLKQILFNLLGNAIKFTEKGAVRVVLSLPSRERKIRIEVIDSGIGMDDEQLARLFRPFAQADTSTTRRFGGTGLGLVLSRHLARLLGGDVTCTSRPGQGSTFTLEIATGKIDDVPRIESLTNLVPVAGFVRHDDAPLPSLAGLRVLLAEDAPDNQRLISAILARAGAMVEVANNGRLAAERILEELEARQPFDAVLMDIQMPEMDGYQATALVRDQGYRGPIIALTAHAMSGDREQCLGAGCTDYATKPIDKVALLQTIQVHATRKAR